MRFFCASPTLSAGHLFCENASKESGTYHLGHYIVADPDVCHGKATFKGTRILVEQVLQQVAKGLSWEAIVDEWRGDISTEAIAEAVDLARRSFAKETSGTLTT